MNLERREIVVTNYMKRKRGDKKISQTVWRSYFDEKIFQDKNSQQSSSTGIGLPDDIVAEFLARLPVRSLRRFKCLNKTWFNLFSDSHFVELHLKQSMKANRFTYTLYGKNEFPQRVVLNHEALFDGDEAKPTTEDASLFGIEKRHLTTGSIEVWGSCNGFLCIFAHQDYLLLVNPSSRETKNILKPIDNSSSRRLSFAICGYSTIKAGGFGYDALNDDYKVVTVKWTTNRVEVYSLKTDSWSYLGEFHPKERPYIWGFETLYLNGAIHWRGRRDKYLCFRSDKGRILPSTHTKSSCC